MIRGKESDFLTVDDAAEILGVSQRTIRRYMFLKDPNLKYRKFNRTPVIMREDLDEFIKLYSTKLRLKAIRNQKEKEKGK